MKDLKDLCRENIWSLAAYSSARNEYAGHEAHVFLDANENPYNAPFNRYPDPLQLNVKEALSKVKGVKAENIFLGNGSDEAIDLPYRIFCRPGIDNVVAIEPTYGMYKVCADINDIEYRPVLLDDNFQVTSNQLLDACDDNTKIIWLCSPNNPTGNLINRNTITGVLDKFSGIVIVDEAYSDFADEKPLRYDLDKYPNLIVFNTMSKAWGCAAIRLGMAFASKDIISIFNKVKYPYNVNNLTQEQALHALKDPDAVSTWINILLKERSRMVKEFGKLSVCRKIYPTEANFFLTKVTDAQDIYNYLVERGTIVRNRTKIRLCGNCLRITIGTPDEDNELLSALREYNKK
nr:histidinol-phosphate transaminase [Prevotella sp.]